jgi:two-component system response regulator YesN
LKSILIVDDDALARIGIKSINDFEERGYSIVGEAENGEKAFSLAKKLNPDIILSDIMMPGLSGVELIKECKNFGIRSSFIMLSSHDDFNYVRDSMRMGALDYILKIDMKKNQIVDLLDQYNFINKENDDSINDKDVVSTIINRGNPISEGDLNKLSSVFNYNKRMPYRIVSIKMLEFSSSLISDTDLQRILSPSLNLCADTIKCFKGAYVQHIAGKSFFCFIPFTMEMMDKGKGEKALESWINTTCTMFNTVLDIKVVIGFSSIAFSLSSFLKSLVEANKASIEAIKCGQGYFFAESLKKESNGDEYNWMKSISEIRRTLFSFDKVNVEIQFNSLIDGLSKDGVSISNVRAASYMVLFVCVNYFNSVGYKYQNGSSDELFIAKEGGLPQFISWLQKMEREVLNSLSKSNGTQRQMVDSKKYITDNYNKLLTLQQVANKVGLSSTYFSRLFYQSTGQKFIDYLTEVRINKARKLLETTTYKILSISQMVGYDNATYFSYLLKKNLGISPQEYRNKVNC